MAAILNIANKGGRIKYQVVSITIMYVTIVWYKDHLMSCFCPNIKMYYIKNALYIGYLWVHSGVAPINTIIYIYIYICICIYIYIYIYIYICIYIYIYVYIYNIYICI